MSRKIRRTEPASEITHEGPYLACYYAHTPVEDLEGYSPETLRTRAENHLALASSRRPGQNLVGFSNELDATIVAVVTDDMPYLLPSITAELTREDASVRLLVHPTFQVLRDRNTHSLLELSPGTAREGLSEDWVTYGRGTPERWIAAEIVRLADGAARNELTERLQRVLDGVRVVADDAAAIHNRLTEAVSSVDEFPQTTVQSPEQLRQLLLWLGAGNFLFLGYTEYEVTTAGGQELLTERQSSSLGLLRRPGLDAAGLGQPLAQRGLDQTLTISTSDVRSTVLRTSFLEELRLRAFNKDGKGIGERRFVGLFTPAAAKQSILKIPVLRDKVQSVTERLVPGSRSHRSREILAVLESLPPNELFHLEADELAVLVAEILHAEALPRMRILPWPESSARFVSALVLFPRRRFTTAVRLGIAQELTQAVRAKSAEVKEMPAGSTLVRLLFRLHVGGSTVEAAAQGPTVIDFSELERHLISTTRSWKEILGDAIRGRFPPAKAARLSELWSDAFPADYRAVYGADVALGDILNFETLHWSGRGGRPVGDPLLKVSMEEGGTSPNRHERARIRLYLTEPGSLAHILTVLHALDVEVLEERAFELHHGSRQSVFLYDLDVKYPAGVDPEANSELLAGAFAAALRGYIESDRFNALVTKEGLDWRQTNILRSYAKYLQQLGTTNSHGYIADTLISNPRATHALLALFHAKFDPGIDDSGRSTMTAVATRELHAAIDEIPVLDADRLLRTFADLVEATLRTNFFLNKPYLSLKLDPTRISSAPLPRPKYEIWVYSPRLEGVHLRFGDLARGGLRWSDRSEDFRTEILGLVKAQEVKNSVIVPAGAKGGFYPKRLPDPASDRQAWLGEGLECYRIFIRGLLDLTDNLVITSRGEKVVPPQGVVRRDSDDYYLVVAADKGTASFSDAANAVAREYGFWLGDAFASGGSVGYDHKQMGITARGAWESVKHHFNELGMDPQRSDFTAVGIGDMSGDVFGNAMLLSPHIRLLAAFDHRHIFLDPSPDAGASFEERQRLFRLPRSSWADYNPSLISPGGGVHSRSAKAIEITEEVRTSLGLAPGTAQLPPHVLIQAILRAPVDLLYNGGIGTYVKAAIESHAEVGDKANDALRVNGTELRARIVAEGGNLGITQRGRIDAALAGVLLNTDAIDNSAGVDCSDHEVNIKIFVDRMIASGRLPAAERAGLLQSLANEVARLVLENNVNQNILLFNDRHLVVELSPGFERMMDWLEDVAELDRNQEGLPSTEQLHERLRAGIGLTSPELSVLAAHAKIELAKGLIASDLADDPWFRRVLRDYFPRQLSERFEEALDEHPLRRQIICTVLANDMVNLGGITFAFRVIEETNATAAAVARAFVVVREVYNLPWITRRLAALPADFPGEYAAEVALYLRRALDRATRWYVTHDHRDQPVTVALGRIAPTFELLLTRTREFLRGSDRDHTEDRIARWNDVGMPRELVKCASDLLESFGLLDISLLAERVEEPPAMIADLYYAVFHRIGALSLLLRITDLPRQNRWEASARAALRDDVYSAVADMTLSVLQTTPCAKGVAAMERLVEWESGHEEQLRRIKDTFAEVTKPWQVDIDSISVALKLLRTLVRR
ncbi:NAD-glutamate dehydrogenase [Paenarthrobacter ureafaciens]|uniref:NAD-glutamate dehydrogenase n=1 Tax=Paenarthrobacter ureafaciens TaxID=37931 RepID=UPI002DB6E5E2|nr:NAD-glutamate dehydrogenase domain-containing protein [Paenarthrobacter ureafaciens]MEC3853962.1 NAD-glutamate dehydrogenase domain-containing protein [Paenarthrobacter ureafaciens]